MPRLTRLRVGALADLAQQLRFAPKKRIIAQLKSATALAGEIDPGRTYPEDWVVFRITGFRPELEAPVMIVGEALRGDLSAFVERVSDRAGLVEGDLPECLSIDELTARWNVNRKTLERARRRGLIAQRYRDADGIVRLAFPLGAVEDYERRNAEAIGQAGAFARIDDETVERLALLGERGMRRFGWSVNEAAGRLAVRTGRGRETMRQLLFRSAPGADEATGALGPRDRRIIDRAARRAVPVAVIARRYDRTPSAIRLIVNQRRLGRIRRWRLPAAGKSGAGAVSEMIARTPGGELARFEAPTTIGAFVQVAESTGKPDAKIERALSALHVSLLARAESIARSMPRSSPRAGDLDRAEADLRLASILRARLVGMELGLVRDTIESRLGVTLVSLAPAHAALAHDAAIDALIESVAAFDPARGGRLAASAGLAINRALASVERAIRDRPDPRGGAGETPMVEVGDWTRRVAPWCRWLDLPPGFEACVGDLPGPCDQTLGLLHGLTGRAPMTAAEIAAELGLSRVGVIRSFGTGKRLLREKVRGGSGSTDGGRSWVG